MKPYWFIWLANKPIINNSIDRELSQNHPNASPYRRLLLLVRMRRLAHYEYPITTPIKIRGMQIMKTSDAIVVSTIMALLSFDTNAFGLGGGVSGNKFDYDACAKIVEGKTSYQEAEKLLGAQPISTGKTPAGFFRHYHYEKQGGLGLGKFGINIGGSKAISYKCFVSHNRAGLVTSVDMQQIEVGAGNAGL